MIRHWQNSNLTLHYQPTYQDLAVQTARGPLIAEYLDRLKLVIDLSLQQYPRVFAFRFDLRFPVDRHLLYADSNEVIERFFASLKAKIRHNRDRVLEHNRHAHDTVVRFVWCREFGQHDVPHYHLAILLNNDAFCTLGQFEMGRQNLFNRLNQAWASALGISVENVVGLVELPNSPFYLLRKNSPESIADFFYRASYLCKAETKQYANGVHGFGASRT